MTTMENNRNGRGLLSLFRRGEKWREIPPGYHRVDIVSDIPVAVLSDAEVLGNIFAPKIIVSGFVYGSTAALETTIEAGGQIWGDIYTGLFHIEPGGMFQGWVSSLDESGFQKVHKEGDLKLLEDGAVIAPFDLPSDLAEGERLVRSENQMQLLRRLQAESAAALAARAELEREFDKRLNEVAGEATARTASLHEQLSELRIELTHVREERSQTREDIRERAAQVERQANEISTTRELLTEHGVRFSDLQQLYDKKSNNFDELSQSKAQLDEDYRAATNEVDALKERLRSIESALQNSLQHSSEQEESLIRWQELAEVTEGKAHKLQSEIDNLNFQAQEQQQVMDMLRSQRKQAEEAWQVANRELEALNQKETVQLIPPEVLAEFEKQLAELKGQLTEAESKHKQYETRIAQMVTEQQVLIQAKQEAQHAQELMLWDKASLESTQAKLEDAQSQLSDQQSRVEELEQQLSARQSEFDGLQLVKNEQETAVSELQSQLEQVQTQLNEVEERSRAQAEEQTAVEAELTDLQSQIEAVTQDLAVANSELELVNEQQGGLKKELRETKLQLEAQEVEAENYYQQMDTQGKRLAEIQSNLIEREIELQQVQDKAQKQADFISRMKEVTQERIGSLKGELDKTRQQLKKAVALVNKYRAQR